MSDHGGEWLADLEMATALLPGDQGENVRTVLGFLWRLPKWRRDPETDVTWVLARHGEFCKAASADAGSVWTAMRTAAADFQRNEGRPAPNKAPYTNLKTAYANWCSNAIGRMSRPAPARTTAKGSEEDEGSYQGGRPGFYRKDAEKLVKEAQVHLSGWEERRRAGEIRERNADTLEETVSLLRGLEARMGAGESGLAGEYQRLKGVWKALRALPKHLRRNRLSSLSPDAYNGDAFPALREFIEGARCGRLPEWWVVLEGSGFLPLQPGKTVDRPDDLNQSGNGVGKTTLLSATAVELALLGIQVEWWDEATLYLEFLSRQREGRDGGGIGGLIERLVKAKVLFLDDFGKDERDTAFRRSVLFTVLNGRLVHERPTGITLNRTGRDVSKEFGYDTYRRMVEMTKCPFGVSWVRLWGPDRSTL